MIEKVNDTELAIYWKNGSIQRFAGAEDPDKHRGINPIDVVFDEYSETKEALWNIIIQPVLRENKGSATFIFTPKGQNHAWKLLQQAKEDPDWFWSVKNVNDTKAIDEDELEKAKRSTPEAFYNQEYLCEFNENAGAFFRRISQNIHNDEIIPEYGKSYQLGVDLAKYQDWTVLTPFDLHTFRAAKQERFQQVDYTLQKARIEAAYKRFNDARVWIDSTGVGEPVYDDLANQGINIQPYYFTEKSRMDLLKNLAVMLEQDKIKIPNDEILLNELKSFQYTLTDNGKVKVKVPEGLHDDCVMSLALAVWQAGEALGKVDKQDEFSLYSHNYS